MDATEISGDTSPQSVVTDADPKPHVQPRDHLRLGFASFLMLFVELALIRWISANNVFVSTATNFVLLASFLGIGLGFLNARTRRDFLRWAPLTFAALVGFALAFPVILATLNVGVVPTGGCRACSPCRGRSASASSSC